MKPRKFLSLRDKNGLSHRREKSLEAGQSKALSRPAGALLSLFRPESAKQTAKGETAEREKEVAKVQDITDRLMHLKIIGVDADHIRTTLNTKFADGDVDRAVGLIDYQQKAAAGVIVPYNRNVQMLGAENRGNVTCYLDSLLFALFAKLDAFEGMLKTEFDDAPRRKLATLFRLWVNLLRSGELIHTDTTSLIQEALAECGWKEAKLLEQQDTSEAFNFITDKLELPLLSLKVDLYHQGKTDEEDDHKVVYERLLCLAVPPDDSGKGIKLEDCLEEYFNSQVDVKRVNSDEKSSPRAERQMVTRSTIRVVTEDEAGFGAAEVMDSPAQMSPSHRRSTTPTAPSQILDDTASIGSRPSQRQRAASVIQRVVLDTEGRAKSVTDGSRTTLQRAVERGSTVVKAMTIPAWQFFRLMPWHPANGTASNGQPHNDDELAQRIKQKPVVGICLKRYIMTKDLQPTRYNTFVDIPDCLRLPNFMLANDELVEDDPHGFSAGYKLVLQSVVCHRGDSLQSGHYISFARVDPKLLTDNRRQDYDPPPDYEEAQWVKFDDLMIENRVSYVDDIKESLRSEMPYLLFYQIVPNVDMAAYSTDETETEPPSYSDSKVDLNASPTPVAVGKFPSHTPSGSGSADGYFGSNPTPNSAKTPNIRLSSDYGFDTVGRPSSEMPTSSAGDSASGSRPQSLAVGTEVSTNETPATTITPESHSPAITPSDETTAQRLSRAAARVRNATKSRSQSQAGEGRLSSTMKQIGGLMRTSKEPLREVPSGTASLQTSTSAPPTVPPSEHSEDGGHGETGEVKTHSHHHHLRQRKGKGKQGDKKEKAGDADRECTVM